MIEHLQVETQQQAALAFIRHLFNEMCYAEIKKDCVKTTAMSMKDTAVQESGLALWWRGRVGMIWVRSAPQGCKDNRAWRPREGTSSGWPHDLQQQSMQHSYFAGARSFDPPVFVGVAAAMFEADLHRHALT
eukprot:6029009-Pyramimonas_sp.AAC.1